MKALIQCCSFSSSRHLVKRCTLFKQVSNQTKLFNQPSLIIFQNIFGVSLNKAFHVSKIGKNSDDKDSELALREEYYSNRVIQSMEELQFCEISEYDECNEIIRSTNLNNNMDSKRRNLYINALLRRCFIELYYLKNYQQAKEDLVAASELLIDNGNALMFTSRLNSMINIGEFSEKIEHIQKHGGNFHELIPSLEMRAHEYTSIGRVKSAIQDLDALIEILEKHYKNHPEDAIRIEPQLINVYKQRMELYTNIKMEMERLYDVASEIKNLLNADSPKEVIEHYFNSVSVHDRRHKINASNMDLISEFENVFVKEDERERYWDVTNPKTFRSQMTTLYGQVVPKVVQVVVNDLKRAKKLARDKNSHEHLFSEYELLIKDDVKKMRDMKITKFLWMVVLISILTIILLEKIGIVEIRKK
ncbi:hypothetical protein FDP41_007063 [Naegleria fowleri]|uniref:Uncharacterized protein n=1 Tax=Naegleria fowleri TaxID=5763 RepID=A0A6A5BGA2_NAEFO|nr:uncharacterized protein FDP41_007063 [Naegleria fowleri]KAF0973676.1 hypothetical protein FDP41_007063 [Naegleria fowleri]CAG4707883.1 unnamed protein product [Naegleria fowleri]